MIFETINKDNLKKEKFCSLVCLGNFYLDFQVEIYQNLLKYLLFHIQNDDTYMDYQLLDTHVKKEHERKFIYKPD